MGIFRYIEPIYRKTKTSGSPLLEFSILGLLKEQDLHGYELRRRLGEILGPIGRLSFGSLYPALKRLEQAGSVTVLKVSDSRTGLTTARGRKIYGITKDGQHAFIELLDASSTIEDDKAFAVRLAFARYLSREARLRLLMRRREQLADRHTEAKEVFAARQDRLDDYGQSLMEHSIEVAANDIAWLDRMIASEQKSSHDDESEPRRNK
jgi:DNA-binding PadR family transcriptional regulator